jgi:hypothetical protein
MARAGATVHCGPMRKALLLFLAFFAAGAAAQDVGLINHLSGDATYTSGSTRGAKAAAYMKIREGDRFTLAPGAQLRVVYFQGSRQESFSGPARFVAGKDASKVESGAVPQVAILPAGVSQRIEKTPELLAIAKLGRAGGVTVRSGLRPKPLSPEQEAEVKQARVTYQQLRQGAAEDDILPELFLYSVLDEHRLYGDMKVVVSEMQRRQPGNADVAAMAEYVESKSEGR